MLHDAEGDAGWPGGGMVDLVMGDHAMGYVEVIAAGVQVAVEVGKVATAQGSV